LFLLVNMLVVYHWQDLPFACTERAAVCSFWAKFITKVPSYTLVSSSALSGNT